MKALLGTTSTVLALSMVWMGAVAVAPQLPVASAHAEFQLSPSFSDARVDTRTGENGERTLIVSWRSTGQWVRVLATGDPAGQEGLTEIGFATVGTGSIEVPDPTPGTARTRVILESSTGDRVVTADRSLHLSQARNLRDFSGYRTVDGRWVRPGVAYRSNRLGGLTEAGWNQLAAEGVDTIVDLRRTDEVASSPDNQPEGFEYLRADVIALDSGEAPDLSRCIDPATGANLALAAQAAPDLGDAGTAMGYPVTVCYGAASKALGTLMRTIADPERTVVFHCTAGKDRTGWASAVLLSILGVDRQTIRQDFLDSNVYHYADAVQGPWLDAAFAQVDALYGDMDTYIHQALGLTDADLRSIQDRMLADSPA